MASESLSSPSITVELDLGDRASHFYVVDAAGGVGGAYLGLRPTQRASGARSPQLRILGRPMPSEAQPAIVFHRPVWWEPPHMPSLRGQGGTTAATGEHPGRTPVFDETGASPREA